MQPSETYKQADVLRWVWFNRTCSLADAPHWLIMTLLEDIAEGGNALLDEISRMLVEEAGGRIDAATASRRLMLNVLAASLYEDGELDLGDDSRSLPRLFDIHHDWELVVPKATMAPEHNCLPPPHRSAPESCFFLQ